MGVVEDLKFVTKNSLKDGARVFFRERSFGGEVEGRGSLVTDSSG